MAAASSKKRKSSGKRKSTGKKAKTVDRVMKIKTARFLARKGINYSAITNMKKGAKKKNDENKPKRARSAYIFFCKEERPKLMDSLDDSVKPIEIMGMLAERWNKADRKTKKKFEKMAQEDRIRYETLKEEAKAFEKPKRPRGAYNFFVAEQRPIMAERSKDTQQKIFARIGKKWKTLSSKEKKAYNTMEADDKKRYEKELKKWEKMMASRK